MQVSPFFRSAFKSALIIIGISVFSNSVFAQTATPPSGSGTSGDPYLIATLDNLYWLTQNSSAWGAEFQQTADIDASSTSTWDSGVGFSPIGNTTTQFTGVYDGQGFVISNLTMHPTTNVNDLGFFGNAGNATITGLGLENVDIRSFSSGSSYDIGALIGYMEGVTLSNSYATGTMVFSQGGELGGLVGRARISSPTPAISRVYADMDITFTNGVSVGGLIGSLAGDVEQSYATGQISASGSDVGGLVGALFSAGNISTSYSTVDISGSATGAGGLAGLLLIGDIENSYATGSVAGDSEVGGLVGRLTNTSANILNSYAYGTVSGNTALGGLVGEGNSFGTISNGYWNTETSGLTEAVGSNPNTGSLVATGLTSAEFLSASNFELGEAWIHFSGFSDPFLASLPVESVNGTPYSEYLPSGSGSQADPYLISNPNNLQWLSAAPYAWAANSQQTADINASGTASWDNNAGFSPIGNAKTSFSGSYDGDGYSITGLTMNRPSESQIGFLGNVAGGTVRDVSLLNVDISADDEVGALAGYVHQSSLILNSSSSGTISGDQQVGGLIGHLEASTLEKSYTTATVQADERVGGLVGFNNDSQIKETYATGSVNAARNVGGLVGYSFAEATNSDNIVDSYATGNVSGTINVGGFAGLLTDLTDVRGYSTGTVTGTVNVGGFAGQNMGSTIAAGYWNTETSGLSTGIGSDDNAQTVTGLNSVNMSQATSFPGFDFSIYWASQTNISFPYLLNVLPSPLPGEGLVGGEAPAGSGTSSDPYQIASFDNLYWLSQASSVWDAYFVQTADIDASSSSALDSGEGFSPIGNVTTKFTGSYDGGNYSITGLTVNRSSDNYVGLFGWVEAGTITNLSLPEIDISGSSFTGALAGYAEQGSFVTNSFASGSVSGDEFVGGMIGQVSGTTDAYEYSGLRTSVEVTGRREVGGVFGRLGTAQTPASDLYATGTVTATEDMVGGVIGHLLVSKIQTAAASGDVQGDGSVGGLVGFYDESQITNSFATGLVTGNTDVGGLVGYIFTQYVSDSYVQNSYASGVVTGFSNVGAFIGQNAGGTVTDSYWDTDKSGMAIAIGLDNNAQTLTGYNSREMTVRSNFPSFDFESIWNSINGFTEPQLRAHLGEFINGISISEYQDAPTGSGTSGDPYQISELTDLYWISESDSAWGRYFVQTADIDASTTVAWYDSAGFSPIGDETTHFTGSYDGGGFTINNLTMNPGEAERGFGFFWETEDATIANMGLLNVDLRLTGNGNAAYFGYGTLIGTMDGGSLSNSYITGTVVMSGYRLAAGGVIGSLGSGSVTSVYANVDMTAGNGDGIGILIGDVPSGSSIIVDSYTEGSLTTQTSAFGVGGLIGSLGGTIKRSYSSVDVSGGSATGGLVGYVEDRGIEDSYATGSVSGNNQVGGLVGSNEAGITNGYATGSVSGNGQVGGLLGRSFSGSITGGYWNTETSGLSTGIGNNQNAQTATGLTTTEMNLRANFTGFDFQTVWNSINGFTEPQLRVFLADSINGIAINEYQTTPAGSGTQGDPYLIDEVNDLYWMSESDSAWGSYFVQTADIDASITEVWYDSAGFSPIGNETTQFTGNYDGGGFSISNLTMHPKGEVTEFGFFGSTRNATIANVSLNEVDIRLMGVHYRVGALIGDMVQGTVSNSMVTGSLVSASTAAPNNNTLGGLVGAANGSANINSSGTDIEIRIEDGYLFTIGGLIGSTDSDAKIEDSYSTGLITSTINDQPVDIGGLVGLLQGSIKRSHSSVDITGNFDFAGGLIGSTADGSIEDSYATGSVTGDQHIGGLIGSNQIPVQNSYATGSVSGNENVGGLIGWNLSGSITGGYWDTETSGQTVGIGLNDNSQTATGLTSSEMKVKGNFSGFDFVDIWNSIGGFTQPRLRAFLADSIDGFSISEYQTTPAGSGTVGDPYQINTLSQLHWITDSDSTWNRYFVQTADIDAAATEVWYDSAGFYPIGNSNIKFQGNYDGGGFSISNLNMHPKEEVNGFGFFGNTQGATIANVNLNEVDIRFVNYHIDVGALIGYMTNGTVSNSMVTGSLVSAPTSDSNEKTLGGLIGTVGGTGSINSSGADIEIRIENGSVDEVGGLIGATDSNTTIEYSYSTGLIINTAGGASNRVGGLIGYSQASIKQSHSSVDITGINFDFVGGLVGSIVDGSIEDSYATGSVTGDQNIGGLTGSNLRSVQNSYATGRVIGRANVGGLMGRNDGSVSGGYWNTETSGMSVGIGLSNFQSATGLTSSEMLMKRSFSGFDFVDTWNNLSGFTQPRLRVFLADSIDGFSISEYQTPPAGSGTEGDPYQMDEMIDLYWLIESDSAWGSYFVQTADIDLAPMEHWYDSTGFNPIGITAMPFTGNYDGQGYTISNLIMTPIAGVNDYGFFGSTNNATLANMALVDVDIRTIESGSDAVTDLGSLIGSMTLGSVTNSYVTGTVSSLVVGYRRGGMIGFSSGSISSSFTDMDITHGSGERSGGLVGMIQTGTIVDSYSRGTIVTNGGLNRGVGGLVGEVEGNVRRSYSSVDVSGNSTFTGGLVGYLIDGSINDGYATGSVSGNSAVGGFTGANEGSISNSYSTGSVSGNSDVGGFTGDTQSGTLSNTFWNTETSGNTDGIGDSNDNGQTVTALTSREMLLRANFPGFDFNTSWNSINGFTQPYISTLVADSIDGFALSNYQTPPSGLGTEENPYQIDEMIDLFWLSESDTTWGRYFVQTADIDLLPMEHWYDSTGFSPIGTDAIRFTGNYDGQGFTISNLIMRPRPVGTSVTVEDIGFFGRTENATIANMGLLDVDIETSYFADQLGALVGYANQGSVTNSYVTGAIAITNSGEKIGGLIGIAEAGTASMVITSSYADIALTAKVNHSVGGLVGEFSVFDDGMIEDSYSTGSIVIINSGAFSVGGLVGEVLGTVKSSYSSVDISSNSRAVGGLAGFLSYGTIRDSYATGSVTGGTNVGGFLGQSEDDVINSYSTGNASGTSNVAGLVGLVTSSGTVSGGYWNTETSGLVTGIGQNDNSQTATGYTTREMRLRDNFPSFDFNTTWNSINGFTQPYISVFLADSIDGFALSEYQTPPSGLGTVDNPYQIDEMIDLFWLSESDTAWSRYFVQTADIDLLPMEHWYDSTGFSPIGTAAIPFSGNYDGQGYSISNMIMTPEGNTSGMGFFGSTNNATLTNMALVDVDIRTSGTDARLGTLIGYMNHGSVVNSQVAGTILTTGSGDEIGGLIGHLGNGTVSLTHTDVTITSASGGTIGGLVGYLGGEVTDSYTTGTISSSNISIGGLVGILAGSLTSSYSNSDIVGNANIVGGLVGLGYLGSIEDSYATGTVTGNENIGGLVGSSINDTAVLTSYSTGTVNATSANGGGLIGTISGSAVATNSYWNTETSGLTTGIGENLSSLTSTVSGLATSQMNVRENFGGFDFDSTWTSVRGITQPYLPFSFPDTANGIVLADYLGTPVGSGTEGNPYQIDDIGSLYWISESDSAWGRHFIQTADIDATIMETWNDSTGFRPIGTGIPFTGNYDGQDYTISNLYISRTLASGDVDDFLGFFGSTTDATISNVRLTDAYIYNGDNWVGLLIGEMFGGSVSNSFVQGTIYSTQTGRRIGGAIGEVTGTSAHISFVQAEVEQTAEQNTWYMGGLVGLMGQGVIEDSYATGSITCTASSCRIAGGVAGQVLENATISRVHSSVDVAGTRFWMGGIVGRMDDGLLEDAYFNGSVTGGDHTVGGITGFLLTGAVITNTYADGRVTGIGSTGALVGNHNGGTITDSYWNMETVGIDSAVGFTNISTAGPAITTGLTSSQMKVRSNFSSFDFTNTWFSVDGLSQPFLQFDVPDSANGIVFADYLDAPFGSGTQQDPYEIETLENLYWLSTNSAAWGSHFTQMADIDASPTEAWYDSAGATPIGNFGTQFTGSYDGGGFTISHLNMHPRDIHTGFGFFGRTNNATIANVGLEQVDITSDVELSSLGALIGNMENGSLSDSYATGTIVSTEYGEDKGGLIGSVIETGGGSITISSVYSGVTLTVGSGSNVGGLAGRITGSEGTTLEDSYSTGSITTTANSNVGGLAGELTSVLAVRSYSSSTISGTATNAGGLVGYVLGGTIDDSYALGGVAANSKVGGLVGLLDGSAVSNAYANGAVSGISDAGGFVGENKSSTITNGFWNTGSSGLSQGFGADNNSQTVTGLSTPEMTDRERFTGFDFANTWSIQLFQTFPYLQSNTPGSLPGEGGSYLVAAAGEGTEASPYQISSLASLFWLSQTDSLWDIGAHFVQTEDIDASITASPEFGAEFMPIGNTTTRFKGSYDGGGYAISELTINLPDSNNIGLFGYADSAQLANISLPDVAIQGNEAVGALAGLLFAESTVSNSSSTGTVSGTGNNVGGLIGQMTSFYGDSLSYANNWSSATVSGIGGVGGLIGHANRLGVLSNSHATGDVSGVHDVGGLIGNVTPSSFVIRKSYATGQVLATGIGVPRPGVLGIAGGLVGNGPSAIVEQSYATGDVSGLGYVGGLVGNAGKSITDSYATGNVSGEQEIGGLVGLLFGTSITSSFSTGRVESTSGLPGGFMGNGPSGIITSNYWNSQTSGVSDPIGNPSLVRDITGLDIGEMADSANFVGFDFASDTVWTIDQGFSFPYLVDVGAHRMSVNTIDGVAGWRMLGNPGSMTYGEYLEPLWTQGFPGADAEVAGFHNVYTYNEADGGFYPISSADDTFGTPSQGNNQQLNAIYVWVFADTDNDGTDDWPIHLVAEFDELEANYEVELPIADPNSSLAGWSMISNPYHTALDWQQMVALGDVDVSNTLPIAYVYDHTQNGGSGGYKIVFGYQLPPGTDESIITNDPIPAMQGFFVAATASGSRLNFKPEHQATGQNLYKQAPKDTIAAQPILTLSLAHEQFLDKAMIFGGSDSEEDTLEINIPKLSITGFHQEYSELALSHDDQLWVSRSLSNVEPGAEYRIPLSLKTTQTGSFTLGWEGLDSFPEDWELTLIDKHTGVQMPLSEVENHSFEISDPAELSLEDGAPRFVIAIIAGKVDTNTELNSDLPMQYSLSQNYPNPFNPSTNIRFELPSSGQVQLVVFDILGRRVATIVDGQMQAGYHQVRFDARHLASGMYLYQLRAGGKVFTKKFTLIK